MLPGVIVYCMPRAIPERPCDATGWPVHLQAAQKVGLVAQTGLAQSVAGLGAGTVNATQFSADTSPDNLNVRLHRHLLSAQYECT